MVLPRCCGIEKDELLASCWIRDRVCLLVAVGLFFYRASAAGGSSRRCDAVSRFPVWVGPRGRSVSSGRLGPGRGGEICCRAELYGRRSNAAGPGARDLFPENAHSAGWRSWDPSLSGGGSREARERRWVWVRVLRWACAGTLIRVGGRCRVLGRSSPRPRAGVQERAIRSLLRRLPPALV